MVSCHHHSPKQTGTQIKWLVCIDILLDLNLNKPITRLVYHKHATHTYTKLQRQRTHNRKQLTRTCINKLLFAFLLYGLLTASCLYVCYVVSLKEHVLENERGDEERAELVVVHLFICLFSFSIHLSVLFPFVYLSVCFLLLLCRCCRTRRHLKVRWWFWSAVWEVVFLCRFSGFERARRSRTPLTSASCRRVRETQRAI